MIGHLVRPTNARITFLRFLTMEETKHSPGGKCFGGLRRVLAKVKNQEWGSTFIKTGHAGQFPPQLLLLTELFLLCLALNCWIVMWTTRSVSHNASTRQSVITGKTQFLAKFLATILHLGGANVFHWYCVPRRLVTFVRIFRWFFLTAVTHTSNQLIQHSGVDASKKPNALNAG